MIACFSDLSATAEIVHHLHASDDLVWINVLGLLSHASDLCVLIAVPGCLQEQVAPVEANQVPNDKEAGHPGENSYENLDFVDIVFGPPAPSDNRAEPCEANVEHCAHGGLPDGHLGHIRHECEEPRILLTHRLEYRVGVLARQIAILVDLGLCEASLSDFS